MRPRNEGLQIVLGFLLLLVIHITVIAIVALIAYIAGRFGDLYFFQPIAFISVFYIGLFQILYVIPLVFWLKRQQRWGLMKGVIISAVITALLNGGCFLLLYSGTL
ncbi:hypothetical protein NDI37_19775 [Funiculus sociatus GB2-A5]|uniref:Uncharacterized protein n=1 Tax=Funiculus sociatus GB2-A5 TaxID=2933946 RepID=A0ABV0JTB9_9CYAN|nr:MULTISPECIES: hypothetical protein [unclassified Trichocoleus]MBD1905472.1 hypothetical protein [Trichocoleus sp. FACHB-832]MBD2062329.1 hypothetical protein [Trichocoleus sp. FACHB-6]